MHVNLKYSVDCFFVFVFFLFCFVLLCFNKLINPIPPDFKRGKPRES